MDGEWEGSPVVKRGRWVGSRDNSSVCVWPEGVGSGG